MKIKIEFEEMGDRRAGKVVITGFDINKHDKDDLILYLHDTLFNRKKQGGKNV